MFKKLSIVFFFALFATAGISGWGVNATSFRLTQNEFKDNNCVGCHAKVTSPYKLTSRYAEWQISTHHEKAVGCEKCHGGDPAIKDEKRAHQGVVPPENPQSRLHLKNLPETCSTCHQGVVSSFTESTHYQKLKGAGIGPSCSTCHVHMGSQVLYTPEETAAMCSTCHNSPNKLMPLRPEIPEKANEVMQSIRRANTMVLWADRLLDQAGAKKLDINDEQKEQKIARAVLAEAKVSWHAFNLESVRKKADDAHDMSAKVKDSLRAKLFPQQ
ncbi:MAG: multiheme c-type cytochrome [Acidobacteriota bacterium]|nr:multiheme c-type cytochrome [Acidobacteriota bacterium]